jgi:hypothetical protein
MLTDSFRNIFHVEIYATIGCFIFFAFFIFVSIHAFTMNNEEVAEMSKLPLDELNEQII